MISVSTLHQDITIPGGSEGKEFTCRVGDLGSVPRLGRSLGEGNGYPLQYSGLENSMDRGAWQTIVQGVSKSWTWPSNFHFHTAKGFSIVNEAEVNVFLEFSCFLCDPTDVGNLISGSSAFSRSNLYI